MLEPVNMERCWVSQNAQRKHFENKVCTGHLFRSCPSSKPHRDQATAPWLLLGWKVERSRQKRTGLAPCLAGSRCARRSPPPPPSECWWHCGSQRYWGLSCGETRGVYSIISSQYFLKASLTIYCDAVSFHTQFISASSPQQDFHTGL